MSRVSTPAFFQATRSSNLSIGIARSCGYSALSTQHLSSPDLPNFIDQLPQRLILIPDHVRVGLELALRVHELGELERRVDVGALDETVAQPRTGGGADLCGVGGAE